MTIPEAIRTAREAHRLITEAAQALSGNDECRSGIGYLLNLARAARALADEVHRLSEESAVLRVSEHRLHHERDALWLDLQIARCGWLEEAAAKEYSQLPENALASDIHRLYGWSYAASFRRRVLYAQQLARHVWESLHPELHP